MTFDKLRPAVTLISPKWCRSTFFWARLCSILFFYPVIRMKSFYKNIIYTIETWINLHSFSISFGSASIARHLNFSNPNDLYELGKFHEEIMQNGEALARDNKLILQYFNIERNISSLQSQRGMPGEWSPWRNYRLFLFFFLHKFLSEFHGVSTFAIHERINNLIHSNMILPSLHRHITYCHFYNQQQTSTVFFF